MDNSIRLRKQVVSIFDKEQQCVVFNVSVVFFKFAPGAAVYLLRAQVGGSHGSHQLKQPSISYNKLLKLDTGHEPK